MFNLASLLSGGIGLLSGTQQNRGADAAARRFSRQAEQRLKAQQEREDSYFNLVQDMDRSGAFDPAKQEQNLFNQLGAGLNIANNNSTAQSVRLGYKPGDTAPLESLRANTENFALQRAQGGQAIRDDATSRRLSAQRGAIGGAASSNLANFYQNKGMQEQGNQQDLSGSLASLLGGLNPAQPRPRKKSEPVDYSFLKNLKFL